MKHLRIVAVLVIGLVVGSCQTITEEMPMAGYLPSSAPVPIVVIQLPQPQPQSSLTPLPPLPAPSNGGGGGGGGGGGNPQPTSAPPSGSGNCQGWPANCNPVASIHAHVYFLQCNGAVVDAKYATEGPWDCDVVLDATPKDDRGKHTQPRDFTPEWNVGGGYTLVNGSTFTPKILGGRTGEVTFSVRVDGVWSNTTTYRFR